MLALSCAVIVTGVVTCHSWHMAGTGSASGCLLLVR